MVSEADLVRIFALADVPPEPWRNGQGVTRTLATGCRGGPALVPTPVAKEHTGNMPASDPAATDPEAVAWHWRVSVATIVQDGAFSCFAGVDRISMLIAGHALTLQDASGQTVLHLGLHQSASYPGETALVARCSGAPLQCLNVMTRRTHAAARFRLVTHRAVLRGECVALVLQGAFCVRTVSPNEYIKNMPLAHVLYALPAIDMIVEANQPGSLLALVELSR